MKQRYSVPSIRYGNEARPTHPGLTESTPPLFSVCPWRANLIPGFHEKMVPLSRWPYFGTLVTSAFLGKGVWYHTSCWQLDWQVAKPSEHRWRLWHEHSTGFGFYLYRDWEQDTILLHYPEVPGTGDLRMPAPNIGLDNWRNELLPTGQLVYNLLQGLFCLMYVSFNPQCVCTSVSVVSCSLWAITKFVHSLAVIAIYNFLSDAHYIH